MRHLCFSNHQESESNTYTTFPKILLFNNSNHKMTLIGILKHFTKFDTKRGLRFFFLGGEKMPIVFYYEQSDRTCLDIHRHILIIYDMFLMSRIPRIIFSYHINFSLVQSQQEKFVKYLFLMKSNLLFIFTINNGAKQNCFPYLKK